MYLCILKASFINVETHFINVENRFDYCEIQTWKNIQIWLLNLENMISLSVLWENGEQFFKQWTENNLRRKESEFFFK